MFVKNIIILMLKEFMTEINFLVILELSLLM